MNLIEISPVVREIQGIENGNLVVPVNNTLVCCMSFLAADTQLYVLILKIFDIFRQSTTIYVTGFGKTDHIVTIDIPRNIDLNY